MGQFHFRPEGYLDLMRSEMPGYLRLQERAAAATGEGARRVLELGTGSGETARRVLELGTGSGETARRVLSRHPAAGFVGVDASGPMLAHARGVLGSGADLRVGRLEDPLLGGPFDLVVSVLAVHHLGGPAKADLFHRVPAVLAPGGRFVLGDVVVPDDPGDAITPIDGVFDVPSRVDEQVAWLRAAGLEPSVSWIEPTWRCSWRCNIGHGGSRPRPAAVAARADAPPYAPPCAPPAESLGDGFVITGVVRTARGCEPLESVRVALPGRPTSRRRRDGR